MQHRLSSNETKQIKRLLVALQEAGITDPASWIDRQRQVRRRSK